MQHGATDCPSGGSVSLDGRDGLFVVKNANDECGELTLLLSRMSFLCLEVCDLWRVRFRERAPKGSWNEPVHEELVSKSHII